MDFKAVLEFLSKVSPTDLPGVFNEIKQAVRASLSEYAERKGKESIQAGNDANSAMEFIKGNLQ